MNLPEQRRFGSRPMVNVTWFEARAFARWLSEQIRPQLQALALLQGYQVALPTETQWQRAATASDLMKSDNRTWPWGDNDDDIDQRANVGEWVGGPSAVGLYAPNPLGLHDMAGNAWEWMDNEFESKQQGSRVPRSRASVKHVSLLSGSWLYPSMRGSWPSRFKSRPGDRLHDFGFRVTLSLAENES